MLYFNWVFFFFFTMSCTQRFFTADLFIIFFGVWEDVDMQSLKQSSFSVVE